MGAPKEILRIGRYTLVGTHAIRDNTGSFTVPVPIHEDLLIRFSNLSSFSTGLIEMRPNNMEHSGVFSRHRQSVGNDPLTFFDQDTTGASAAGIAVCGAETDIFDGEVRVRANSGSYRTFDSEFFVRSGSSAAMSVNNFRSVWRDSSTIMSSVQVYHTAGPSMSAGNFEIYKFNRPVFTLRDVLFKFTSGDYVGPSERRIWDNTDDVMFGPFAASVPAIASIGGKQYYQSEGTGSNLIADYDTWTIRGFVSRSSGQTDPLGGTEAFKFENVQATSNSDTYAFVVGQTAGEPYEPSFFFKRITTSGATLLFRNSADAAKGTATIDVSVLSDGWERITLDHPAVTVNIPFTHTAGGSGGASFAVVAGGIYDFYTYFPQVETAGSGSGALTSPMIPADTRVSDSLSFSDSQIPELFKSGIWTTTVIPEHNNLDVLSGSGLNYLYYFDASNNLVMSASGENTIIKLATTSGSLEKTVTYDRDSPFSLTVDFVGGELTVSGANSGNGTKIGTVSDWPGATSLFVGSDSTPNNHLFGLISEPTAILPAVPEDTILAAAGNSGVWAASAEYFELESGTVDYAQNIWGSVGDLTQSNSTEQPGQTGTGVSSSFTFNATLSQSLDNSPTSSPLVLSASFPTSFVVVKLGITGANGALLDLSGLPAGVYRGLTLEIVSSNVARAGARTTGPGLIQANSFTTPTTDTGSYHVIRATVNSSGIEVAIDGVADFVSSSNTGLQFDQTSISLGSLFSSSAPLSGSVKFACLLDNPTDQQIADTEAAIIAKYT